MPDAIMMWMGAGYVVYLVISIVFMLNKKHRDTGIIMFLVWIVLVGLVLLLTDVWKR